MKPKTVESIPTTSNVHELPVVRPPARVEETTPRLALSPVETASVTQLLAGGEEALLDHVRARAGAFVSADGDGVRLRSLARAAALAEVQMGQMSALLSAALSQRDEPGAKLLDKLLTSATKRFTMLMDELRAERQGGRRSVLVVGAAQHVHVGAGE
jgi:hypothetical protein